MPQEIIHNHGRGIQSLVGYVEHCCKYGGHILENIIQKMIKSVAGEIQLADEGETTVGSSGYGAERGRLSEEDTHWGQTVYQPPSKQNKLFIKPLSFLSHFIIESVI